MKKYAMINMIACLMLVGGQTLSYASASIDQNESFVSLTDRYVSGIYYKENNPYINQIDPVLVSKINSLILKRIYDKLILIKNGDAAYYSAQFTDFNTYITKIQNNIKAKKASISDERILSVVNFLNFELISLKATVNSVLAVSNAERNSTDGNLSDLVDAIFSGESTSTAVARNQSSNAMEPVSSRSATPNANLVTYVSSAPPKDNLLKWNYNGIFHVNSNFESGVAKLSQAECKAKPSWQTDPGTGWTGGYGLSACVAWSTITAYDWVDGYGCVQRTLTCDPNSFVQDNSQKVIDAYKALYGKTPDSLTVTKYLSQANSLYESLGSGWQAELKKVIQAGETDRQLAIANNAAHVKGLLTDADCKYGYTVSADAKNCVDKNLIGLMDKEADIKTNNTQGNNIGIVIDSGGTQIKIYDAKGVPLTGLGVTPSAILKNLETFGISKSQLADVMTQYKEMGLGTKIGQYDLLNLAQGGMWASFDWTADTNLSLKGPSASTSLAQSRIEAVKNGLKDISILNEPIPVYDYPRWSVAGTYLWYILPSSGNTNVQTGNPWDPNFNKANLAKTDPAFLQQVQSTATKITSANTSATNNTLASKTISQSDVTSYVNSVNNGTAAGYATIAAKILETEQKGYTGVREQVAQSLGIPVSQVNDYLSRMSAPATTPTYNSSPAYTASAPVSTYPSEATTTTYTPTPTSSVAVPTPTYTQTQVDKYVGSVNNGTEAWYNAIAAQIRAAESGGASWVREQVAKSLGVSVDQVNDYLKTH